MEKTVNQTVIRRREINVYLFIYLFIYFVVLQTCSEM